MVDIEETKLQNGQMTEAQSCRNCRSVRNDRTASAEKSQSIRDHIICLAGGSKAAETKQVTQITVQSARVAE